MSTVQIKDSQSDNQLKVNSDGSINVDVSSGGGGGGNASVGTVSSAAPTSATEIAGVDPEGNLIAVSVAENGFLNVNGTSNVTGTVTSNEAGLNSFQTSQYTVGTAATQITPTPLANRSSISVRIIASSGALVYIGENNTVTTSNGYPLGDGESIELDLTPSSQIWAVASAAGQTVCALEMA